MAKALDLTNKRFGKLTAIEVTYLGEKRSWVCVCDCGAQKIVPTFQLMSGNNTSCGCGRFKVHIGDVFGSLTVLSTSTRQRYGHGWMLQVRCRCICGNEKDVFSHYLTRGTSTHCGCLTKQRQSESRRGAYGEALKKGIFSNYRQNAKTKNLLFELSDEQMENMFAQQCYYCGVEPNKVVTRKNSYGSFTYNGIDRLDSSLGYTVNNVVTCCSTCNYLKSAYSKDRFLEIIQGIARHHNLCCDEN